MTKRDDEASVTIARFETLWEASIAKGVLETAGINALVPKETQIRWSRSTSVPTGSLQVLKSDQDRAVAALRRAQIKLVEPRD